MEADTKKTRKERFIERKQANTGKREYVVKTSLAGKIKEPVLRDEIDEWVLTCDTKLSPIIQIVDGQVSQVRGLRRCCSSVCSGVSYKNRDQVGALNIMRCLQAGAHRPNSLSRNLCSTTKPSHFVLGRQGKTR